MYKKDRKKPSAIFLSSTFAKNFIVISVSAKFTESDLTIALLGSAQLTESSLTIALLGSSARLIC